MKPTAITGATGFLGQHLVEQLRRRGEPLRLLCRGKSPWDSDPAIEIVRGDITSPDDVERLLTGAGRVYHLAGIVSREPNDARLYRVHVDGTRYICEAALRQKPERLVIVSSSGTIAVDRQPIPHDETAPYQNELVGDWPYYLSKIYAEKLAFYYARQQALPIVVVNPSLLLGPGDDRGSSTGDVQLFLEGQIQSLPLGGLNFVHAGDAANGLVGAMERGRLGERYLLGGPNWTFREMILAAAKISGRSAPKMQLGVGSAIAGAHVLRRLYPLIGKTFKLDDASIRMSALFWYLDSTKARNELGFTTRDPYETMRETIEYLQRKPAPVSA